MFMAIQRLRDIERSDDPGWGKASRSRHQLHYDLEAFIWVTFYSILIYTSTLFRNEEKSNKGSKLGNQEASGHADSNEQQASLKRQRNRQRVIDDLSSPFQYFTLNGVKQAKGSFVLGGIDVLEFI